MWESQLAGPHMALGPPWAWLWPELTPPSPGPWSSLAGPPQTGLEPRYDRMLSTPERR